MIINFDLISDLHTDTWNGFDWTGQPTSPYCIVAGDVCRDRTELIKILTHLGTCYSGVFYIDGNEEHRHYLESLGDSYLELMAEVEQIPNVVFLQNNVVVMNGVAILATNGWWGFDFDPTLDLDQSIAWWRDHAECSHTAAACVLSMAYHDAAYLAKSVRRLQTHKEVHSIVIVSHTVPTKMLCEHDLDLVNTWRFNGLGNNHLRLALDEDTEGKIKTWCFGHYHKPIDREIDGVRYVSNPRGRGNTPWGQHVYYPKRISIEI